MVYMLLITKCFKYDNINAFILDGIRTFYAALHENTL